MMRPGTEHMVYTIRTSMMVGCHFHTESMIRIATEVRQREGNLTQAPTNEFLPISHAFTLWYLADKFEKNPCAAHGMYSSGIITLDQ
jgi:hypothetical protein